MQAGLVHFDRDGAEARVQRLIHRRIGERVEVSLAVDGIVDRSGQVVRGVDGVASGLLRAQIHVVVLFEQLAICIVVDSQAATFDGVNHDVSVCEHASSGGKFVGEVVAVGGGRVATLEGRSRSQMRFLRPLMPER